MFVERSGFRVFSIAGIEVSVSIWYGFLMFVIVALNGLLHGALFAAAITVSLLIHEFGHAIPAKYYRLAPSILLHGFGGLCFHQASDSDWKDILIVVAGPLVQMFVGGIGALVLFGVAGEIGYTTNFELLLLYFVGVSFVWGAINLVLPLFPLDGGQLFHLILRRFMVEAKAQEIALKTRVTVAIPVGILAIIYGWYFGALIVALLVIDNVNALRSGVRLIDRRAKVRASSFIKETLDEAEKAFVEQDWREAARLCHVMRAANDPIPTRSMDRIWEILGIATTRMGEYHEAMGWLKKAPSNPDVEAAIAECEAELARDLAP